MNYVKRHRIFRATPVLLGGLCLFVAGCGPKAADEGSAAPPTGEAATNRITAPPANVVKPDPARRAAEEAAAARMKAAIEGKK